jgi:histidinol-phosphate aminotransferase
MTVISPKCPSQEWVGNFFVKSLVQAAAYHIDVEPAVKVKLDQNESPWDWPEALKKKILDEVGKKAWNRYPSPNLNELNEMLAAYCHVPPSCIVTGPGSNYLIALLLDNVSKGMKGRLVIPRPSFALFELHSKFAGIDYDVWPLTADLEYSLETLPSSIPAGSVILVASPNNPTGSFMSEAMLEELLVRHPDSLIVADEAYHEFAGSSFVGLLARYSNLLIIRTMSKTMGAAGIRLGFLIGSPGLIEQLTKPRLPYILNHFAVQAAIAVLRDQETREFIKRNVEEVKHQRDLMWEALAALAPKVGFEVKKSMANFFLLRWKDDSRRKKVYESLMLKGILVRDVSKGHMLSGCLRVTVGSAEENKAFLTALDQLSFE